MGHIVLPCVDNTHEKKNMQVYYSLLLSFFLCLEFHSNWYSLVDIYLYVYIYSFFFSFPSFDCHMFRKHTYSHTNNREISHTPHARAHVFIEINEFVVAVPCHFARRFIQFTIWSITITISHRNFKPTK